MTMCHSCDAPAKYRIAVLGTMTRDYCLRHGRLFLNGYLRPNGDEADLHARIAALTVKPAWMFHTNSDGKSVPLLGYED